MKNFTIKSNVSIRKAMKKLSKYGQRCMVIVDDQNKLLGTLSDGDVRKAILKGIMLRQPVLDIYNREPTVLIEDNYDLSTVKNLFTKSRFDLIPVVDNQDYLKDILLWESVFENDSNKQNLLDPIPTVIMAGGSGTRLEPFTTVLPKPLIPIHGKPIIQHIMERFAKIGTKEFILTVNYKANIIKAFFKELKLDFSVKCIEEEEPLGTAGSLQLMNGKFSQPYFVTNCDIIVKTDYSSLYEFHLKGGYDITLVASAKEFVIPYGTCELNSEGNLSHMNEKPQYDFLINTGLYVLSPNIIDLIPTNKFYHITNLIEDAKKQGKKIGVFPIDDDAWIDIGQWAEFKEAIDKLA